MAFTSKNLQYKKGGLSFLKGATFFFLGMSCVLFMTQAFDITPVVTQIQSYFKSIILTPNGTNTAATGIYLDGSLGNWYFAGKLDVTSKLEVGASPNNISIGWQNGRVGIGTTSPAEKLDVNGNIQLTHTGWDRKIAMGMLIWNVATNLWILWSEPGVSSPAWAGASGWDIYIKAGSWGIGGFSAGPGGTIYINGGNPGSGPHPTSGNVVLVNDGGRVGIGTTGPAEKLDVNGTGKFTSVKVGSNLSLYSATPYGIIQSSSWLQFNTNGDPRMTIDNAGNVWIGVTPSTKLHVAWATKIDASIQIWHEYGRCDQYSDRWTIVYTEMCSATWGTLTYTPAFLWCVGSWAIEVSKKTFMTWTSWTETGEWCVCEASGD